MPVPAPQLETVHVEREVVEPETVRVPSPPTAVEVVVARPAPEPRREAAALTRQDARARPATSVQAPPAAHSEPAGAPDPAQERTMVVSIGRIEVNAQRPSPPPVRPTTRAWGGPRLSLDDYLRERNGGRR
ncbi:MAG TPA: hypothetical protein VI300_00560 [Solirubrobacter sp.]